MSNKQPSETGAGIRKPGNRTLRRKASADWLEKLFALDPEGSGSQRGLDTSHGPNPAEAGDGLSLPEQDIKECR